MRNRRFEWLLALVLAVTCGGCAGLEVKDVPSTSADMEVEGVRYYESSPYLLVHTDNAGGLVTRILYLPDRTKKRSIRPYSYLAKGTSTLEFQNGVLKGAQAELDAGVIPRAVVSAIEVVAKAAIAAANEAPKPRTVPAPYLYKIVVNGDTARLIGPAGARPAQIRVDLPKEK